MRIAYPEQDADYDARLGADNPLFPEVVIVRVTQFRDGGTSPLRRSKFPWFCKAENRAYPRQSINAAAC